MNAIASRQRPLLPVREAVVTRVRGSAPTAVGASMCLLEDGSLLGTVGGGRMEYQVCQVLRSPRSEAPPALLSFTLGTADDQCCGGQVEICVLDVPLFFSELYQSGASRLYQRDSAGRLQLVAGMTRLGREIGSFDAFTCVTEARALREVEAVDQKVARGFLPSPGKPMGMCKHSGISCPARDRA